MARFGRREYNGTSRIFQRGAFMPKRKGHRHHASTPMGEVFREGFKPVRTFFNGISRRAESAFWNVNDRLNEADPPKKNKPKSK
jgi:hypothetical protein